MRLLLLLLLATVTDVAAAEDEAADAYCGMVRAIANSESALTFFPSLFLDYGLVNGNDVSTGAGGVSSGPASERLTFGARWSLLGIGRGIVTKRRATADCERYRAQSGLSRFIVDNREAVSPAALEARIAVLRQAMPRAQELVRQLRGAVERAHATVEELQAAQLRYDDLSSSLLEAEALRAGLPPRTDVGSPAELLERHRRFDAQVGRHEGVMRMLSAVDLSLRGGYDRVYGLRDVSPGFIVLSLSFNPAVIYQPFAESDAQKARARYVRAANDGVEQRAELLADRLRALLGGQRRRQGEVRVLVHDAEARLKMLEGVDSDKLRRFRDSLWFEWVKLRAEDAFLRVHTAELARSLGEP
jgi:hypothetical protein